ncbi:MAG: transposase, partial [Eubacteriaceae bacterium]|nr:transposase [Eubacteriaceae bacterium]
MASDRLIFPAPSRDWSVTVVLQPFPGYGNLSGIRNACKIIQNEYWDEWGGLIKPFYHKGKRDRPPCGIETMLRVYLIQACFDLSGKGVVNAIYNSYVLRTFVGIDLLKKKIG